MPTGLTASSYILTPAQATSSGTGLAHGLRLASPPPPWVTRAGTTAPSWVTRALEQYSTTEPTAASASRCKVSPAMSSSSSRQPATTGQLASTRLIPMHSICPQWRLPRKAPSLPLRKTPSPRAPVQWAKASTSTSRTTATARQRRGYIAAPTPSAITAGLATPS